MMDAMKKVGAENDEKGHLVGVTYYCYRIAIVSQLCLVRDNMRTRELWMQHLQQNEYLQCKSFAIVQRKLEYDCGGQEKRRWLMWKEAYEKKFGGLGELHKIALPGTKGLVSRGY
jgi:hypothetical protein